MRKLVRCILWLVLTMGFTSCGSGSEKEEIIQSENTRKKQMLDEAKDDFVLEYNIQVALDTLSYAYSIQYQHQFDQGLILIQRAFINDVYLRDGQMYASVKCWQVPGFYFELALNENSLVNYILSDSDGFTDRYTSYMVVARIDKIREFGFKFESDFDGYETSIMLEDSYDFYGKGELIDLRRTDQL
ncbi:MAG: hypothetical protein WBG42_17850 [Cryomorphaceae bacterium]